MAQNIYDHPEFFAGYTRLPRQVEGLAGAPEWPALKAMLPPLAGKRVADLGCGFGWASRYMREQGAASVVGYDLSENMLARARADTTDDAIEYRPADLDTLILPRGGFDLVYSSLTFHYVEDFDRLAKMMHEALRQDGSLIFSIEHPIFMAPMHPHWMSDEGGRRMWPLNSYSLEGERRTTWFTDGVRKYHRTIGTTLNTLIRAGFSVRQIDEFAPSRQMVDANPDLAEELERPMLLLISASKA